MELPEVAQQDLHSYLRIINRRKTTIAAMTLIMVVIVLIYVVTTTPVYSAVAQVLVPSESATSVLAPPADQQSPAAANLQRSLADAQQFAEGGATKTVAAEILHKARQQVKATVSASATADVLSFESNSTNKQNAAATANAYANGYIRANRTSQINQYAQQVQALDASIAKLRLAAAKASTGSQQQVADQSSITSLTQSLQQLQAASELVSQTGPSVINPAAVPTSPSSPKKGRDLALALLAGLILGLGMALLRERLDDKLRSLEDVQASSAGRPVIGILPFVSGWRRAPGPHVALIEDPDSAVAEAYRTLRTSIQFLGIDEPRRIIGITSSTADEGKSTATANLAVSFARAGQNVVAVSFDFRRPRLHHFFGLDNKVGATSVLLGESTLDEALRPIVGEAHLRVLTSGPVPPNPAEILSLDRTRHLVETLATDADVILLDCPPVLPVTDALLISRLCDTVLVMAVASSTKKRNLQRTYTLLTQVKAQTRGTIVNRAPQDSRHGYGYGYGYSYGYSSKDVSAESAPSHTSVSS